MSENIMKIWGERRRILLTDKTEIDLLYLNKNSFCSTHKHKHKINKFVVIKGKVIIEDEHGWKTLSKNQEFTIYPTIIHRFIAIIDSIMIELAYTTETNIDPNDIERISQGGKIINGAEITLDEMDKKVIDKRG